MPPPMLPPGPPPMPLPVRAVSHAGCVKARRSPPSRSRAPNEDCDGTAGRGWASISSAHDPSAEPVVSTCFVFAHFPEADSSQPHACEPAAETYTDLSKSPPTPSSPASFWALRRYTVSHCPDITDYPHPLRMPSAVAHVAGGFLPMLGGRAPTTLPLAA